MGAPARPGDKTASTEEGRRSVRGLRDAGFRVRITWFKSQLASQLWTTHQIFLTLKCPRLSNGDVLNHACLGGLCEYQMGNCQKG